MVRRQRQMCIRDRLFSESVAVIIMVSFSAAAIAAVSRFYGWAATQIFQLN